MEDFDIEELSRYKRETEKKLRELEQLVLLKNETIRKLKFKLLDQRNICEVAEQRLEEALKAQREAEIWKNDIAEMDKKLSDDGAEAFARDKALDKKEKRISDRKSELKKKEDEISEREQRVEQKEKFLNIMAQRQRLEYVFMGAVLLIMWCISGLIADMKDCWNSYTVLRTFFYEIGRKTVFPVNVLVNVIPVLLLLMIISCVVFGICRIIQRYIDLLSLRVLFGIVLAVILIRLLIRCNSICIVGSMIVLYVIVRSVIDSHNPKSKYSKY